MDNLVHLMALTLIPKVGSVTVKQLISYCGSAEDVFKAKKSTLLKIPGIGDAVANNILAAEVIDYAEKNIYLAEKSSTNIISYLDPRYPKRLKPLFDAPVFLYHKGSLALNFEKSLGIVGTRQASEYGKKTTDTIVEGLKNYQPVIVSGLAYGIDISAHKAALAYGMPTVAVLGTALDLVYPSDHIKYIAKIEETGCVISEVPFGVVAARQNFLQRNRVIAGLSDALVVVESASKGGSLVTAEQANNYHKEVFAVPGNLENSTARGTNDLIKKNLAQIYTSPNDIIESLNWDILPGQALLKIEREIDLSTLSNEEAAVVSTLKNFKDLHIDELSWQCQVSIYKLSNILLTLEFKGLLASLPGKRYKLI